MGWRIVQQPNGLLARFSEVVDDFTDYDMTQEEAEAICGEYGIIGPEAKEKVQRGLNAGLTRYTEALRIIQAVHGDMAVDEWKQQMSVPVRKEV